MSPLVELAKEYMVSIYGDIPPNAAPELGDTEAQDFWMARFGLLAGFAMFLERRGIGTPQPERED